MGSRADTVVGPGSECRIRRWRPAALLPPFVRYWPKRDAWRRRRDAALLARSCSGRGGAPIAMPGATRPRIRYRSTAKRRRAPGSPRNRSRRKTVGGTLAGFTRPCRSGCLPGSGRGPRAAGDPNRRGGGRAGCCRRYSFGARRGASRLLDDGAALLRLLPLVGCGLRRGRVPLARAARCGAAHPAGSGRAGARLPLE